MGEMEMVGEMEKMGIAKDLGGCALEVTTVIRGLGGLTDRAKKVKQREFIADSSVLKEAGWRGAGQGEVGEDWLSAVQRAGIGHQVQRGDSAKYRRKTGKGRAGSFLGSWRGRAAGCTGRCAHGETGFLKGSEK